MFFWWKRGSTTQKLWRLMESASHRGIERLCALHVMRTVINITLSLALVSMLAGVVVGADQNIDRKFRRDAERINSPFSSAGRKRKSAEYGRQHARQATQAIHQDLPANVS